MSGDRCRDMVRGRRTVRLCLAVGAAGGLLACPLRVAAQPVRRDILLPDMSVVATAPGGEDAKRDELPYATSVLDAAAVNRDGTADALRALERDVGGVALTNAQNNPFQPSLAYRGFEASPLGGNPQGLAIYLGGVRFNQPFGDTVNWDLIPDTAIDRITVAGANPAYGLNALGGALSVDLKTGFTFEGTELTTMGGSFGRIEQSIQHGRRIGDTALYVAARGLNDDGYRPHSPSQLRQVYADLGHRRGESEVHFNVIAASNRLTGNGTTPVELLAVDRDAVFTYPDSTENRFARLAASGKFAITDRFTLRANLYYGRLRQRTKNGDAAEVEPCEADPTLLCQEDGPPLRTPAGGTVPNFVTSSPYAAMPAFAARFADGGPYAFLNETSTRTTGYGGMLQGTRAGTLLGRPNRLMAGISFDGGLTDFEASTSVGALTLDRGFAGPSMVVASADNAITPVGVRARSRYAGLYLQDMLSITDRLTLTAGGRLNHANIVLEDRIGTALNGDHSYTRFNPQAGASYALMPGLTLYGGYAEANRAPTPAELSCADPDSPCSLTNFFVGDPALKQVVARGFEAGLRGRMAAPLLSSADLSWHAGYFRTTTSDDIQLVSSGTAGRAYFRNIGSTRRQGLELGAAVSTARWSAFLEYTLTDATYRSALTLNSPSNPSATPDPADPDNDDARTIQVEPGDRLPGIPMHALKAGVEVRLTPEWKVGVTARAFSGRYLVGDEANLQEPTSFFVVADVAASYRLSDNVEVFGLVQNLFDRRYATFGTFSPVESVPIAGLPDASDPRSLSLGPPRAAYAGLRITF